MMSRRFSKVSSVILLVLFAFFFASTNLFFHTHEGLSGKIVHSHPWGAKSHNHTGAQFQTISMLSANIFEMSAPARLPDCPQLYLADSGHFEYVAVVRTVHCGTISLRAPPMFYNTVSF